MTKGGPDGGDGGPGGNVFIVGDSSLNTLIHLKYHTTWNAKRGVHGGGKKKRGAKGADVTISVPIGTVVWRLHDDQSRQMVADVVDTIPVIIALGGAGGSGNTRFVSSTQQEPVLAEQGEEGQKGTFLLELKLLADVGLVGVPNAGKSTLISHCSGAKPKVAPYPFTTTEPVLGVVQSRDRDFVMMEVPGLIEGAHTGAGLGHEFLRHVERARLLVHLIDGGSEDPMADWRRINLELMAFDEALGEKPQIIAINKIDIPEVRQRVAELEAEFESQGPAVFFISGATGEGFDKLIGKILEILDELPKPEPQMVPAQVAPHSRAAEAAFQVTSQNGEYSISAPKVERLVAMANLNDWKAMIQIWRELQRLGVVKELEAQGVQPGDTVRIGSVELEWY